MTLVITPPWTSRSWALPVLSVPAPTPEVSQRLGRRHKTIAQWARQMILAVRRWLPGVEITVIGEQTYSVVELGNACTRRGVRLIAPLRLDAALILRPTACGSSAFLFRRCRVAATRQGHLLILSRLAPQTFASVCCGELNPQSPAAGRTLLGTREPQQGVGKTRGQFLLGLQGAIRGAHRGCLFNSPFGGRPLSDNTRPLQRPRP